MTEGRMTFHCDGCDQDRDFERDYGLMIVRWKKGITRICRLCRRPKAVVLDVYWDGKPEENLADDPRTGKPREFGSRAEKAAYLKERGLIEAGDRVRGAPLSLSTGSREKPDRRHEVKMALKQVKEMGIDYRRQAYLKIVKEGQRHA